MTCICGMVRDGHVYMAGDMMGSNGFTGRVYPDSKVFINGNFIIGYTSSFRMGQILEWNWQEPLRQEGISDRQYMQQNVVESLRETFAFHGYGVKEGLEDIGGNFLIGYKGSLYEMQDNFSLLCISDFSAIGSGQYHAESVLLNNFNKAERHPFEIMQEAIGTAAYFTQSVSEECTMYSSNDEDMENIESILGETDDVEEVVLKQLEGMFEVPERNFFEGWGTEKLISYICDDDFESKYPDAEEDNLSKVLPPKSKVFDYITIYDSGELEVDHVDHQVTSFESEGYNLAMSHEELVLVADDLGIEDFLDLGSVALGTAIDEKVKQIVDELNKK